MKSKLHVIQYLRAVAALAVVVAHIGWVNPLWGAQGIDVFFIISGFISALVSGREARPGAFILARLLRVAPVYWLATLAWNELHPANEVQHLLLSLVFIPHIGPKGMIWPVIEQGWTLLYEAFFYCAFATALMLPQRRALSVLTCVFVLLVAIGRAVRSDSAFSQVFLSPLLIEFLAGVWLHQAWQRG